MKWKPWTYQKRAVKFLTSRANAALFLDPGLGKTSISLAAFVRLKKEKIADKALIIAPLRVCYSVWPGEISKWDQFSGLKSVILHGSKKKDRLQEEADIYLINPEGLAWLFRPDDRGIIPFSRIDADTLIIDELSKFKNGRSQRFKFLRAFHKRFSRRWGLTGSPAPNGLLDLHAQMFLIDDGRSLGRYFMQYRARYFFPTDYNRWNWALKPGANDTIRDQIKPLTLSLRAEDYLDLPELVETTIRIDLPKKARKVYDQFEDILIAKVKGEVIVAANAAVASTKCRQLANGAVYVGEGKTSGYETIHDEKIKAMRDLVEELQGQPLLVAYEFDHDLARLRKEFGEDVPAIGGSVSAKASKKIIEEWNRNELPLLFAHPGAMGHGLNAQLGDAAHIAWFSLTWNLEYYDQLIRRIWRQGNEAERVFVYRLVARKTVDEIVASALKRKTRTQNSLLEGLRALGSSR